MKLIKQVTSDLLKEFGWVLFYGVMTSAVIMAFLLIIQSYGHVSSQNEAITQFVDSGITITRIQSTQYNAAKVPAQLPPSVQEADTLSAYYEEVFSSAGNAGTYAMMPGRLGYMQVIVLLGIYSDLTPFGPTSEEGITLAVSYDLKDQAEDTILIDGNEYALHVAPEDMELYHPLFYLTAESGYLNNTLFVFSKDYSAIQEVFPASEYWELRESDLLGRIILSRPSEQDIIRLRSVVSKNTGSYVNIQTIDDYLSTATISGVRTHQTYLLFYIATISVLVGAMLTNLYRILKRKIPDYVTHHLFGASSSFIFARMLCFGLIYNAIPLVWTSYIMSINQLATPINVGLLGISAFFVVTIIVAFVHRQFIVRFSQGLRRE